MQTNIKQKIRGLINISNKAGYLIIGSDNLKNYNKKLYLVIRSDDAGKNLIKISKNLIANTGCEEVIINSRELSEIISIDNCKIVGIKNQGLAKEIIKYIRGENFV